MKSRVMKSKDKQAPLLCSRKKEKAGRILALRLEYQDARNRGRRRRSGMDWLRAGITTCDVNH